MASTRMAFGSIMGTVSDTATAASDLVKTAGLSIGMLNTFVLEAAVDQKERGVAHRATFRETVIGEASREIAMNNLASLEFCAESEQNAQLFNDAQSKLLEAFNIFDGGKPTKK